MQQFGKLLCPVALCIALLFVCTDSQSTHGGFTKFQKDALAAHNKYRAKHGAPPLKLNKAMCDYAQEWANHLAQNNRMQHRPDGKFGENIFISGNVTIDGASPVAAWYGEVKHYNYNDKSHTFVTGHFSQVIWKNSKELGIAYALVSRHHIYVVANYDPPGNHQGQYANNVQRPQ